MNKVYCRYCGKPIDEDASFCTHCGKEQNVNKASSWSVSELVSRSKTIGLKLLALIRIPFDYAKTIKMPRVRAEKVALWRKRLKLAGKVLLALSIVALLVAAGAWGYSYYYDEYLPEKRLDEACKDILDKLHSNQDSIRLQYSKKILWNDEKWGYDNIDDRDLQIKLMSYRDEAFRYIENEAYNNNASAQFSLGQLYFYADNYLRQDTTKAVYWWNEAVKQDYVPAYNNLGLAFENGWGVEKNMRKAVDILKIGAEKGESYAQANYGRLYRDGVKILVGSHKETRTTDGYYGGNQKVKQYYDSNKMDWITVYNVDVDDFETLIPQDIEKAKYWWNKSAAQGNEYAKELLQKVYE